MWNLIETCAGGGALTLSYLQAKGQIVPYQGSKWRLRHELTNLITIRGYPANNLGSVHLVDAGPWGDTWNVLSTARWWIRQHLSRMMELDPRDAYDFLHKRECSSDPVLRAAEHLFLSRLAFSGKAVADRDGIWRSAGFNKTSAYGVAGTNRFGAVRPMIPALVDRLDETWKPIQLRGERTCAISAFYQVGRNAVAYIDPVYVGTTRYPDVEISRLKVISLALRLEKSCGLVIVSEAEVIPELVDSGWTAKCLRGPSAHRANFRSSAPEYVMVSPDAKRTK